RQFAAQNFCKNIVVVVGGHFIIRCRMLWLLCSRSPSRSSAEPMNVIKKMLVIRLAFLRVSRPMDWTCRFHDGRATEFQVRRERRRYERAHARDNPQRRAAGRGAQCNAPNA